MMMSWRLALDAERHHYFPPGFPDGGGAQQHRRDNGRKHRRLLCRANAPQRNLLPMRPATQFQERHDYQMLLTQYLSRTDLRLTYAARHEAAILFMDGLLQTRPLRFPIRTGARQIAPPHAAPIMQADFMMWSST